MNIKKAGMESKPTDCNEQQEDTNSIECRACLQKFAQEIGLYNLFEAWPIPWPGMGCTIAEDLTKMAQIQISIEENLNLICFECCSNLQRACKFVHIVQNNDLILRQRYSGATDAYHMDWPKPIQIGSCKESSYVNNPDIEIKQEIVSDEETEMIPQENSEGMAEIKIEPEELVQPVHSQFTNGINGNDAPVSSGVNGQDFQEIDYLEEMKQEPPSEEDVKQQFVVSLECILCSKKCKSVSGLKSHVIAMHSYKGVKRKFDDKPPEKKHVCSTCRRSFATSTDLMVHETCHNKLVCYSCNRNFETFNLLTRHRKTCKAAVSDVVKPKTLEDVLRAPTDESRLTEKKEDVNLECVVCKEQFSDVFYLQVHQEIHNITVKTEDKEKEIKQEILDQFSDSAYGTAKLQELFEDDSK